MRISVLGSTGMLGHKVCDALGEQHDVRPVSRGDSRTIDATRFSSIAPIIARASPNVVVNCIGVVKSMRGCLLRLDEATIINSVFPHQLARLCKAMGVRLIHISTDCVFSGKEGNYDESAQPDPVDWYGYTKLLGEVHERNCLTIRTSFFGRQLRRRDDGLLEWFLGREGEAVDGYSMAIFSGFPTVVLADIIKDLIENYPNMEGLRHISSEPISKYSLLVKIRDMMALDIRIGRNDEFHCDRSLNSEQWQKETRYPIPSWEKMVCLSMS